jgi:hypothetical protein
VPFTISHAAAVLPLERYTRNRLPLAALMIGSMAPDFSYFMPVALARSSTHDLDGLFFFCWPVGLAVWLLFVKVLERPTIALLPLAWRERIKPSDPRITLKALALASIGILVGALTHIAWDAFTHRGTAVVEAFPALNAALFEFRGHTIRVFALLQILSSVLGLLALARWGYNLRHAPPPNITVRHRYGFLTDRARIGAALVVFITSGATALLSFAEAGGDRFVERVYHLLVGGMIGWMLAWCVVAVLINRTASRQAISTAPRP